ncbi:alpha-amylase family glycosyl hydrolase [Steroidobacter sp.]|uniref:alpha-amylase family glycosyl hydrolase n=1 Tax=Steroidobacter sp. TaxID=1978227 RepID=UPI001A553BFA|nr:alpha-amylase family glycosyl hydrolase [Steroidobacter sp.]MBL8270140.1 alpha glucosidase [Steroidobacter sp.]
MSVPPWWRGGVIYEIYPRSFVDSNGDGVGDLPGIVQRLDYVAELGVDAIWIAPFFRSPMADFGYDVADYRAVDPLFGSMADFDRLLARAHQLGLKVMIDQVLSHTSIEHEWFRESRQSRDNPKADWYVWAEPKPDGSPPNNWLSIFGGVAWRWEPRRRQYYLHNFLSSQPDLNFHQPELRRAVLDNVRFWLDKGVDGLRLDAINFCFHDQALRDNPPKPMSERTTRGFSPENPYAYQYHRYDNTQPENLQFLTELRALLDEYPQTASLAEISSEDSIATTAEYTTGNRLHMGYSFELLSEEYSAGHIRKVVEGFEAKLSEGWPCWAFSNHDVRRVVTRWGGSNASPHLANQLVALLCSLRGSVCMYQGEELGLHEAAVPFESLRDPYGIAFWPNFKGRDGCRTPMPWNNSEYAGFSTARPWLPVAAEHRAVNVESQLTDRHSVLSNTRAFLQWRKRHPALRWGDIKFVDVPEPLLAFTRCSGDSRLFAIFNLSPDTLQAVVNLPAGMQQLDSAGVVSGELHDGRLTLPGHAVVFATYEVPS